MKRNNGFSLIELLVVVMIVGILSAVAIPSYTNYVTRGKVAEATSTLSALRVTMEQYYQDNRSYLNAAATCGPTTATWPPTAPAVKYFTYSCRNNDANSYVITATGVAAVGMAGFVYTIDQTNARQTTGVGAGWILPANPTACWITSSGGTC
jgi:type IV pilus assembly protein PilE